MHDRAGVSCRLGSSLCQHGIPLSLLLLCFGVFFPQMKIPLIYAGMLSAQLSSLLLINGINNVIKQYCLYQSIELIIA